MVQRKSVLFLLLCSVIGLLAIFSHVRSDISYAQVTPNYNYLAPCPTCESPSYAPVISGSVGPTAPAVFPTGIVSSPAPSADPCETADASLAADHDRGHHHHRKHHGRISGGMEALLKFLMELINKLLELLGGGSITIPTPTTPEPSSVPNLTDSPEVPALNPCITSAPTQAESPTQPQPSTTQPMTIQPSPVPSSTAQPSGVQPSTAPGSMLPVGVSGNWTLKFDDEFDGTALDTSKWSTMEGWKMNNTTVHASNVSVSGGNLILTLPSVSSGAFISTNKGDGAGVGYEFPVGGYTEARVYFPGNGADIYNWPAWWTTRDAGWPATGEHDIAEGLGTLTVNYHSGSGANNMGTIPGTWSNAFHVYGVHRQAGKSDVYWDGVKVKSYTTDDSGVTHSLHLNIGSGYTAVYGTGSQMKVDYVRAWEQ